MRQSQETIEGLAAAAGAEITLREASQLTDSIAKRLETSVAVTVSRETLLAAGWEALRQCLESYDPAAGIPFLIGARQAVRGAMLDAIPRFAPGEGDLYTLFRQLESLAGETALPDPAPEPENIPVKMERRSSPGPVSARTSQPN